MDLSNMWNTVAAVKYGYDHHRKKVMEQFQLSAIEVDVLLFLANQPDFNTAADIVHYRKISKGHVSIAVKLLTEKGFLFTKADEKNKKKIRLYVTDTAAPIVEFGQAEQLSFLTNMFSSLTASELKALSDINEKLKTAAKQHYGSIQECAANPDTSRRDK